MAHIVHVIGTLNSGGVQRLILALAATPPLAQHRHSVVCIVDAQGSCAEAFQKRGMTVYECPVPWPRHFGFLPYRVVRALRHSLAPTFSWRFARLLRQIGADLVHTHVSSRVDLQARAVLQRAGRAWVWTVHGLYRPEPDALAQWRTALQIPAAGRRCVTGVSQAVTDDFRARVQGPENVIRTCHSATDLQPFRRMAPARRELRQRYGIPTDAVVFGSVGRLVEEKAYDVFIRAAAQLHARFPEVRFLIAGDGKQRGALEKIIAELNLQSAFHLIGDTDQVPEFLGNLDVFVLPSRREGFGMVLVEALAAGLPCIATRVGGIPEILDERAGILVDAENPEALAAAMETLLAPEVRERLRQPARALAEPFSMEKCATAYAAIYSELLERNRGKTPSTTATLPQPAGSR